MLVLSRKEGEEVVVPGCGLTVTVLDVGASRVRLGFSAPPDLGILRKELWRDERASPGAMDDGDELPRLLIADADRSLLICYADYLSERGYQVATAADALECVERVRELRPDVLVLDPCLPWGGGDGVLAVMQEDPTIEPVPVIVVTYRRDPGQLYRLAAYPISDLQFKPLGPRRLAERIAAVLGPRSLRAVSVPAVVRGRANCPASHKPR
ncbi:MAG: carbon storage regulator [Thermoguttaceae bacterium]|jgi:carbon storage regulator CsrA|nr:carbon storage regulator [Thermoguttaceae bacterium]